VSRVIPCQKIKCSRVAPAHCCAGALDLLTRKHTCSSEAICEGLEVAAVRGKIEFGLISNPELDHWFRLLV